MCNTEEGWKSGKIIKRDFNAPDPMAYQVQLDSGEYVDVPEDSDAFCFKSASFEDQSKISSFEDPVQRIKNMILGFKHPEIKDSSILREEEILKKLTKMGWVIDETDQKAAVEAMKKLTNDAWSLFTAKSMKELATNRNGAAAADAGRALVLLDRTNMEDNNVKKVLVAQNLALRSLALVGFMAPKAAAADADKASNLCPDNMVLQYLKKFADDYAKNSAQREEARRKFEASKLPVTVLTGFLGSGKTTLLNYILSEQKERKYAVIENEYGSVGVDDQLVRSKFKEDEDVVEMNNGCICCTVRGDLVKTLNRIAKMIKGGKELDGVIIETTGMADPAPVAQTFFADDNVANTFRIDGIVTVVDCKWIIERLDEEKKGENEAVEQVAFADVLLLNKTDLVDKKRLEEVKSKIRSFNSQAKLIETKYSRVDLREIINIGGFSLDRVMANDEEFFNFDQEHEHDSSVSSVGISFEGELNGRRFEAFITKMMRDKGVDLYRSKGVVAILGMHKKFVFQAVHMLFGGEPTEDWKPGEKRTCRFVFIGKNLNKEEIEREAKHCIASDARYDAVDRQFIFGSGDGYKA